jgi:hypothetical protein
MATAKWSTPGTEGSIHASQLNSLANGSTSARMAYDNSTALSLYGKVSVVLGSLTPTAGGSITLRALNRRSTTDEEITDSLESYTGLLTTTASAKLVIFPLVRLYPFVMGFVLRNDAGVALAASGNDVVVQAYGEDIS